MTEATARRRAAFRALHAQGCFVLPNPWDIGSARRLARLGFRALASTSAGLAWSLGCEDYQLGRDDVLAHLHHVCAATDLPVNADYEGAFAVAPEDVAHNVTLAIATGIAGLSVEDRDGEALFPADLAARRIAAARAAIDRAGADVILVARSEGLLTGTADLAATIARLRDFAAAGADCLYAPGLRTLPDVAAVVEAVAPKPVNVLLMGGLRVDDLAAAGVRRVSTGGALAWAAWQGFDVAAAQLVRDGSLPARG